jgi:hypothetical protein
VLPRIHRKQLVCIYGLQQTSKQACIGADGLASYMGFLGWRSASLNRQTYVACSATETLSHRVQLQIKQSQSSIPHSDGTQHCVQNAPHNSLCQQKETP